MTQLVIFIVRFIKLIYLYITKVIENVYEQYFYPFIKY